MLVYILAAACSMIMTFFLAYWTLTGVERQYPEPVLKQMIAGCWFFGVLTIMCLMAAPLINIVEEAHDVEQIEIIEPVVQVEE